MHPILPLVLSVSTFGQPAPSFSPAFAGQRDDQVRQLQAHYLAAEEEIACRDVSSLAPEQRSERDRLLRALEVYRMRGDFGLNTDFTDARMPHFVDAEGRRCAVAELLHVSGEDALVEEVRATANHAWIVDLAGHPVFEAWLDRSGLTVEEAARIQGPPHVSGGTGNSNVGAPLSAAAQEARANSETNRRGGGGGSSADPAPSAAGASTGSGNGSAGSAGATGAPAGSPGSASTPAAATGAPRPSTLAAEVDDGWWLWWEYNKVEFLRPNRLAMWSIQSTGDDPEGAFRRHLESARRSLAPRMVVALDDPDASVRAAAAGALGRVARGEAVPHLLRMLADANQSVRHQAILALGTTGSAEAVLPLLALMRTGGLEGQTVSRVSPFASPLAIVALALGRRNGFDPRIDDEVARRATTRERAERNGIGTATMIYHMLAPTPALEKLALALASDSSESPGVRCRAIESLRSSRDPAVLSRLQHFLSSSRMDERRSAALALGSFDSPLALAPLLTAYELEPEPLTRGFILVSIGRRGGEPAREFLLKTIERCEGGMRKWCALALGLVGRADGDPAIARAIRTAAQRERNRGALGAYSIAAGLARDEQSRPALRDALAHASDPQQRMYAATGLALVGGDAALSALRERLAIDPSPLVQTSISLSLGVLGEAQDAPAMLDTLTRLKEPGLQGFAASAVAFHGTREALFSLTEFSRRTDGPTVRRAAAIEGLGMMLGTSAPLVLGEVSRQSNYTVFSDWVKDLFQVTL